MADAPGLLDRLAQILVAARGGHDLGGGDVLTFVALLLHADTQRGRARPSIDAIAEMSGLHRRSVQRALDRLLACGAIESTEDDRTRRSAGGRGKITQFDVAPHAIRGDAATLCARERVADLPRIEDQKGGECATVVDEKGGVRGPKPWREMAETVAPAPPEHSEHSEHSPQSPPRGAGTRSAPSEDEASRVDLERECQQAIEGIARARNPWALRGAIVAFLRDGGTAAELATLIEASDDGERTATDRVGLLVHWISHVAVWRGVLEELDLARRQAGAERRHAASATQPVRARELITMPARETAT